MTLQRPGAVEVLQREAIKLKKINAALMSRVERSIDQQFNAFSLFETAIAKMRVFRVPQFLGAALMLGLLGTLLLFVSRSF